MIPLNPTITSRVIADSVNTAGVRLVTLELVYPRFVHQELLTHRNLCLAGDARLDFDLPAGTHKGGNLRIHSMSIAEFVDKWHNGARRVGARPKTTVDVSRIDPSVWYPAKVLTELAGLKSRVYLNAACRDGLLPARRGSPKGNGNPSWEILGADFVAWRESKPESNRYDMQGRLRGMRIRQCNDETFEFGHSTVVDCWESGEKEVLALSAGRFSVAGSADHLILTDEGYVRIADLVVGSSRVAVIDRRMDEADRADPLLLKKIDGQWRSRWQEKMRKDAVAVDPICRECQSEPVSDAHHIIPVHQAPDLCFVESNLTYLCVGCHKTAHARQGWQGGNLAGISFEVVDGVTSRGVEMTYDLKIDGDFPNFAANGIIVHNSRNAGSSRAIPAATQMQRVRDRMASPIHWTKNTPGMTARAELEGHDLQDVKDLWALAAESALAHAQQMVDRGVHKAIANRVYEPFTHIVVLVSATDWANLFELRDHEAALPEFQLLTQRIKASLDESVPVLRPPLQGMWGSQHNWHLPLVRPEEREGMMPSHLVKLSTARCARVSLQNHDGSNPDPDKDVALHDQLVGSRPIHASPTEHQAAAHATRERYANFRGWEQYRHYVEMKNGTPEDKPYDGPTLPA